MGGQGTNMHEEHEEKYYRFRSLVMIISVGNQCFLATLIVGKSCRFLRAYRYQGIPK
jgi:hypothetical protein